MTGYLPMKQQTNDGLPTHETPISTFKQQQKETEIFLPHLQL